MDNLAVINESNIEILNMGRASVKHNWVLSALCDLLKQKIEYPCAVFAEQSYKWAKDDASFRIPDISISCDPTTSNGKDLDCVPWFIVEVLSPNTQAIDRNEKMEMYAKIGVEEYWLIDPELETIEMYLNENRKMALKSTLQKPQFVTLLSHSVTLDVSRIFDCKIKVLD